MMSVEQAQLLLREGRIAEAERAFAAILAREPEHVQALNVMALVALRGADFGSALALIERARRADALNPLTLHNQGRILDAAGSYEKRQRRSELLSRLRRICTPPGSIWAGRWSVLVTRIRRSSPMRGHCRMRRPRAGGSTKRRRPPAFGRWSSMRFCRSNRAGVPRSHGCSSL